MLVANRWTRFALRFSLLLSFFLFFFLIAASQLGCVKKIEAKSSKPLPTTNDRLDIRWAQSVVDDDTGFSAEERLIRACISGDLAQVKLAIAQGAAPSHFDFFDRTPLMYAAKFGHREIVSYLCSLKVDVNATRPQKSAGWPQNARPLLDIVGGTALMECAMHGDTGIARILLANGAKIEAPGYLGPYAALFHAAHEGNADMVELLMEKSGDTIPLDWDYQPVLSYAVRRNKNEVVDRMLKHKHRLNATVIASALCAAADSNNLYMAEKLLRTGIFRDTVFGYVDHRMFTPLIHASRIGRLDLVQLLVQHGVNVNLVMGGYTSALSVAAEAGHIEIVRLLLAHGAQTDLYGVGGQGPITLAIQSGNAQIVQLLLQSKVTWDRFRYEVSGNKFWSWPPGLLKSLLPFITDSLKIDIKADSSLMASLREQLNDPYLSYSVIDNAVTVMQMGVKLDFENLGITPLMAHAVAGDLEAMKRDIGEDNPRNLFREITLNMEESRGRTALDWAILAGKLESVKFLVENGAEINSAPEDAPLSNVNSRALNKRTVQPLGLAFSRGDAATIEFLLEKGARMPSDTLSELPHIGLFVRDRPSNGPGYFPLPIGLVFGRHLDLLRKIAATQDPSFTSDNCQIAFLIASMRGDLEMAEYLLKIRPEIANDLFHTTSVKGDGMGEGAFIFAATFDHTEILELILREARPPSDWQPIFAQALGNAERCGRKKATAFLLQRIFCGVE